VTLVHLYLGPFEPELLDVSGDAHGQNDAVEALLARAAVSGLERRHHCVALRQQARHTAAGVNLDAALLERAAGRLGDLLVFGRQDLRKDLDHGYLTAQLAIEAGELDPDRPRAH